MNLISNRSTPPFRLGALSVVKHDYLPRAVAMHPRFELVCVADDADRPTWTHERNQLFADEFGVPYVKDVARAIEQFGLEAAAISPEAERHCELAARAAQASSSLLVMADLFVGGMHYLEYDAEDLLRELPAVDLLLRYEGEPLLRRLAAAFGDAGARVGGVWENREAFSLDELPPPAFELLPIEPYFEPFYRDQNLAYTDGRFGQCATGDLCLVYDPMRNFTPDRGAVSFWFRPAEGDLWTFFQVHAREMGVGPNSRRQMDLYRATFLFGTSLTSMTYGRNNLLTSLHTHLTLG